MTDNELISEFMGIQQVPEGLRKYLLHNGELRYDTSWDLLMPVVEKINNEDLPEDFDYDIFKSMQQWILDVSIENVYNDAIAIIKMIKISQQELKTYKP